MGSYRKGFAKLLTQCDHNETEQKISEPIVKLWEAYVRLVNRFTGNKRTDLIVAFKGGNNCRTQASRDADAESPDHTANEEIPDHVRLSPSSYVQASQRRRGHVKTLPALT